MNLDQAQIKGTLYDIKDRYKWTGTQAQWDALDKSTLPQDTEVIVNITDDYDESTPGITIDTLTTMEQVNAETDVSKPVGAGAVKELNNSLGGLQFGVDENGNYGYIKIGADTVTPFKQIQTFHFITGDYEYSYSVDTGINGLVVDKNVFCVVTSIATYSTNTNNRWCRLSPSISISGSTVTLNIRVESGHTGAVHGYILVLK